jgi:hypothetical protein
VRVRTLAIAVLCLLGSCSAYDNAYGLNWRLDPAFPVPPDASVVHVLANEGNCAGVPPESLKERLLPPLIEYRSDEVAIGLFLTRHSNLLLSCLDVPLEITLSEPVGDRPVVQLPPTN